MKFPTKLSPRLHPVINTVPRTQLQSKSRKFLFNNIDPIFFHQYRPSRSRLTTSISLPSSSLSPSSPSLHTRRSISSAATAMASPPLVKTVNRIQRSDLLEWLSAGTQLPLTQGQVQASTQTNDLIHPVLGKDFLLVDLRREDHQVLYLFSPLRFPISSNPCSSWPLYIKRREYRREKKQRDRNGRRWRGNFPPKRFPPAQRKTNSRNLFPQGGTIRGSLNLPAQTLHLSLPTLYEIFTASQIKMIIFYCGTCPHNHLLRTTKRKKAIPDY